MGPEILIFGKAGCAKCDATKNKINHYLARWGIADEVTVTYHELTTPDGLAEAAYHDVSVGAGIPATIIRKLDQQNPRQANQKDGWQNEGEIKRYIGEIPKSEELLEILAKAGLTIPCSNSKPF